MVSAAELPPLPEINRLSRRLVVDGAKCRFHPYAKPHRESPIKSENRVDDFADPSVKKILANAYVGGWVVPANGQSPPRFKPISRLAAMEAYYDVTRSDGVTTRTVPTTSQTAAPLIPFNLKRAEDVVPKTPTKNSKKAGKTRAKANNRQVFSKIDNFRNLFAATYKYNVNVKVEQIQVSG